MWNPKKILTTDSKYKFLPSVILTVMFVLISSGTAVASGDDATSIRVHGDWVVTVSNPDGSIAQERSFKNALVTPGLLVGFLVGQENLGQESDGVWFNLSDGPLPWFVDVTATGTVAVQACRKLLAIQEILSPSYTQDTAATISAVTSSSFTLSRNLSLPLECVDGGSYSIESVSTVFLGVGIFGGSSYIGPASFTEKTLPAPITGILADQVVTLKATISFQ